MNVGVYKASELLNFQPTSHARQIEGVGYIL